MTFDTGLPNDIRSYEIGFNSGGSGVAGSAGDQNPNQNIILRHNMLQED